MAEYKYKAFISYSHRDKDVGVWLHEALERFRTPKAYIGKPTRNGPRPARLARIFRDDAEVAAAEELGPVIEQALQNSETLIVICTPNSARSEWVEKEIRRFKQLRKGADVFAVIAAGKPHNSDPLIECFPEALKWKVDDAGELTRTPAEPLAPDIQELGRDTALTKVAAALLSLDFDELAQREDKRRAGERRRALMLASTGVSLIGLAAIGLGAATFQLFSNSSARANLLAAYSEQNAEDRPELAALLAAAAMPAPNGALLGPTAEAEIQLALLSENVPHVTRFSVGPDAITAIAISPDGERVVTADARQWVVVWDVETLQEVDRWRANGEVEYIHYGLTGIAVYLNPPNDNWQWRAFGGAAIDEPAESASNMDYDNACYAHALEGLVLRLENEYGQTDACLHTDGYFTAATEEFEDGGRPGSRIFNGVDFGARTSDKRYGVAATGDGKLIAVRRMREWERVAIDRFDVTGVAISDDTQTIVASDRRGTVRIIRTSGFRYDEEVDDEYAAYGPRAEAFREIEFSPWTDVISPNQRFVGLTRSQQTITIFDGDSRAGREISRSVCGGNVAPCLLSLAALSDAGEALLVNLPDYRLFRLPPGAETVAVWTAGDWIAEGVVRLNPEDSEQVGRGAAPTKDLAADRMRADEEGRDPFAISAALAARSRFAAPESCIAYESSGEVVCDRTEEVLSADRDLVAIAFDDYLALFDSQTAKVRKIAYGCFMQVDTLVFAVDKSAAFARGRCGYDGETALTIVPLPLRGRAAFDALCAELANGRQEFTNEELVEFSGLLTERDRNPCKRNGLLTWDYYRDTFASWLAPAK